MTLRDGGGASRVRGGSGLLMSERTMSSAKRPPRRRAAGSSEDVTRRTEIVQAANRLIAHHGLGTSLQQIADAPASWSAASTITSSRKMRYSTN